MGRKKKAESKAHKAKFDAKLIQAAHEVGFIDQQIANFTDSELLKAAVIRANPSMALRFREIPEPTKPVHRPVMLVASEHRFDVALLAGFGPPTSRAANEQREIEAELRRRNIHHVKRIVIERDMKADSHNKVHSTVTVHYEKEAQ